VHEKRVTIKDVAAVAGVALGTASDALRDSTRDRVLAAAKRLGYRPTRAARNLRLGRHGALALVMPVEEYLVVDFYMALAPAAAAAALAQGASLMMVPAEHVLGGDLSELVDGAIVVDPSRGDARLTALELAGIPFVTIDRALDRPDHHSWVGGDNERNVGLLLDHLAACGAERVAMLSADATWSWIYDSERAYSAWARARGQEPEIVRMDVDERRWFAQREVERLLAQPDRPDALLAMSEQFALGASLAARSAGLRVPEDLQIVGAVDGTGCRAADPPITVVDPLAQKFASAAVDLLLRRLAGEDPGAPITIPGNLVVRGSTRSAAAGSGPA
jgi:DNA-binding LacI/PurR family transcriptional regulator